jgi:hypothetical protein
MSILPKGKQWLRHAGRRQRLRIMAQQLRPVLELCDYPSVQARARATARFAGTPDGEVVASHLMLTAWATSQSAGVSFADALNYLIDSAEAVDAAKAGGTAGAPGEARPTRSGPRGETCTCPKDVDDIIDPECPQHAAEFEAWKRSA